MSARIHHLLDVSGVRIHAVEQGQGPLVLLLHGFPESWYSWRHQLEALSAAGYRAVAIDQRGYGRSSKFWKREAYRIDALVADAVGVVQALGETRAVIIGHDWGAPVAWTGAWLHPEIFRGVIGMSVPFAGRGLVGLPGSPFGEREPEALHAELAGPGQCFYQDYFGRMDAVIEEIESDVRGWLRDAMFSLSGDALSAAGIDFAAMDPALFIRNSAMCVADGARMRDRFVTPPALPAWLSEQDLDVLSAEFQRSGFAGGLSYYHCVGASWRHLEAVAGRPLTVPSMFIGGQYDVATIWGRDAIARAGEYLKDLRGTPILQGCGHWIQQERPRQTNTLLLEFLQGLRD
ncbi:alpha/beta hydrolase [Panacagrimonas sp.]|uniref:alpha/beta hydrolase n=1 Tax=Panacagrimonas sp. TaxID=2480088 RepID=UPI003B51E3F4